MNENFTKIDMLGRVKKKLNIRFNNNRNHLNTGNTACNLEQYHSKICNFEGDLQLISRKWLGVADDKSISVTKRKETSDKREKYCQNKWETFIPYGLNKCVEFFTYCTNIGRHIYISSYDKPQTPFLISVTFKTETRYDINTLS